jgi:hypothetical protein
MKIASFDIFRKDLLGNPVWIEAVPDLETAKLRMAEWAKRSPAEYFVFNQETSEIVCDNSPDFSSLEPYLARKEGPAQLLIKIDLSL